MDIQWYGQACFKMTSDSGFTVITDPFDQSVGYPRPPLTAEVVTISHGHHDHDNREWIKGNPIYLDKVVHREIQGISIHSFPSYHDDQQGAKRGKNLIFVFVIDGIRICHAGDLGHQLGEQLLGEIGTVDILMVPVGGYYTIDGPQAWALVQAMKPRITIPMHFRTAPIVYTELSDAGPFFASAGATPQAQQNLHLDATTLADVPSVVLLDWQHKG